MVEVVVAVVDLSGETQDQLVKLAKYMKEVLPQLFGSEVEFGLVQAWPWFSWIRARSRSRSLYHVPLPCSGPRR